MGSCSSKAGVGTESVSAAESADVKRILVENGEGQYSDISVHHQDARGVAASNGEPTGHSRLWDPSGGGGTEQLKVVIGGRAHGQSSVRAVQVATSARPAALKAPGFFKSSQPNEEETRSFNLEEPGF